MLDEKLPPEISIINLSPALINEKTEELQSTTAWTHLSDLERLAARYRKSLAWIRSSGLQG